MSTSRKIQLALGTIILWSSTSVSSFAATNTITSGKFHPDTVKLPVESIPSRQLVLTQNSNLIVQSGISGIRATFSRIPGVYEKFAKFDEIWRNPADRKKRLFDYCNSQKDVPVDRCFIYLDVWAMAQFENARTAADFDELDAISDEIVQMRRATNP